MFARRSFGPDYECKFDWPQDCFVQCGGSENRGFFFESFPKKPDTFIRGDSKESIEAAEEKCWNKLINYINCKSDHSLQENFEKRNYRNGVGFCKTCGLMAGDMFLPDEICVSCGKNTYNSCDKFGNWYCEDCPIPEENLNEWQKNLKLEEDTLKNMSQEDFEKGLKEVLTHISGIKE